MTAQIDEQILALSGFTVGVTAARRGADLSALFQREGARVLHTPALQLMPFADRADLQAATRRVLRENIDLVIATTAVGFSGWIEAADSWGMAEDLVRHLHTTRLIARGGKTRGALRTVGLQESYSPPSGTSAEILDHLLESDLRGLHIAVQLYGEPLPQLVTTLRQAGADVIEIPVYRWTEPDDPDPLQRMVEAVLDGCVDALTFTSVAAARHVLALADRVGQHGALLDALRTRVPVVCVGAVTAEPLLELGIRARQPHRPTLGGLVRMTAQVLEENTQRLLVHGTHLELRGQAIVLDGILRQATPAQIAVLRALVNQPGVVISRSSLAALLPGGGREHAVETAISRLRVTLGRPELVETVTKRGYRLRVPPVRS